MESISIRVTGLAKRYRIWRDPASRLKYPLLRWFFDFFPSWLRPKQFLELGAENNRYYRDFFALNDVTFEMHRGEALGIIGRNGSGKSTLLQMIAGTLTPTEGSVEVLGRVAALLELGSGFNMEFTGEENIYLNGSLLGLAREEITKRFSSIVEFSELGDFVKQPVRTYSSGMVVRLAFAIAAHVEPDILIVDEALSVGDSRFQLKCARAIDEFIKKGVTLLFVSHDSSSVKRLCSKAILLEKGRLVYQGNPNDVVNLYSKLMADGGSLDALSDDIKAIELRNQSQMPLPPAIENSDAESAASCISADENQDLRLRIKAMERVLKELPVPSRVEELLLNDSLKRGDSGIEFSYGGQLGTLDEIKVVDVDGDERYWFTSGETVRVLFTVSSAEAISEPIFALTIKNKSGVEIYGTNTLFGGQPARPITAGESRKIEFEFPVNLVGGDYFLSLGFTYFYGNELIVVHRRYDVIKIQVQNSDRSFGIANLNARISGR